MEINTVLVADDSDSDRLRLVSVLLDGHFSVVEAYDGEDAVKKTLAQNPDMVFMDVSMPKLNGFQAARRIAKNPSTQHIPIIMVGGAGRHTQERWAIRQGARGYIDKPVDRSKIFNTIAVISDEDRWASTPDTTVKDPLEPEITNQFMAKTERQLTEFVGPLARMLVRQAAARANSRKEFYNLLAKQIPDEGDREAFLNLWYDELV